MTRKTSLILAVLFLCLAGQGASAQARLEGVGEQLVNDFLENVITLQGRFEQSLIDAEGEVTERSSGTLKIERPGRFRWSYAEPYEQWLVADGLNIWSYDVELAQVTVKPQADALANTPALLLGGSVEALQQFRFDKAMIESGTTWVRMIPVDTSSGFERMELGFFDGQLTRMVFFDNLDQTTLVALYDVTTNEPIDAEQFSFTVPDDVDLVGVPVVAETLSP
ncbi:MAG: outer membrane lipoprotein chaperone LolA [Woeseiaceae bacterium]